MIIYLIPKETKEPIICNGLQVSNCRTQERQSVAWTGDDYYRECKIPEGTGFTDWLGRAIRCDP